MSVKLSSLNLINIKYLFNVGMSGAHVKGELLRLLDPIKSSHWNVPAGTLGVLLDKGERYYIVALHLGMFGFAPFSTDPTLWEPVGEEFDGSPRDLEQRNNVSTGRVDMEALAPAVAFLKEQENCSAVFQSPYSVTAVFDGEPQGPEGYRSPYQIRLQTLAGLIAVMTVIEGETKTIKVSPDEVMTAVHAAVVYLNSRGNPDKVAVSEGMVKTAKAQVSLTHQVQIADVDRYITDLMNILVCLRESHDGYSLSCQALSSQVGISSYTQYWHYDEDELGIAKKTYKVVCKVADSAKEKFEYERLPIALLNPHLYSTLQDTDLDHKERSGVYNFNYAALEHRAPDWRDTIYGGRYPDVTVYNLGPNRNFGDTWFNLDDKSREIEVKGARPRDQVYSYHYADSQAGLVKYGSFVLTAEQQRAFRERFLGFMLGLSPSLVGAFLLWMSQQNVLPHQVDQMLAENPAQVHQLAEEFKAETFNLSDVGEQKQEQEQGQEPAVQQKIEQIKDRNSSFPDILAQTLKFEGGYSNHPKDPGGETYKGITRRVYEQYLRDKGLPVRADMRRIPKEHIEDIYSQRYWDRIAGNDLPPIVAQQVFDFAVNSGTQRAIKTIQQIVGARPDGQIGQHTLQAIARYVQKYGEERLASQVLARRKAFLEGLGKKRPEFAKGWANRVQALQQLIPGKGMPAYASCFSYHFAGKNVPISPGAPKFRSKNVPPRWTYDFFSPQVWSLKEPDNRGDPAEHPKMMPLDPNAYAYETSPHRLMQHQVIVNTPYGKIHQPQDAQEIQDLYRGVHATHSFDLAAVYANNRSTVQDPPIVIEFTTTKKYEPDADALNYDIDGINERVKEIEGLAQAMQRYEKTGRINWRFIKSVFKEVESMSYDDYFEGPDQTDWDVTDYISDQAKRLLPADVAEFFKTLYPEDDEKQKTFKFYVPRYLRAFYEHYLRPLFVGGAWDNRLLAFLQNSMRFLEPINEEEILALHKLERFNPDTYNPWEPPETDEEDENEEEGPWYDRVDEEGREMVPEDSIFDSTWSPTSSIIWQSPKRATNKGSVFYHGTSLSRARQALQGIVEPHQAAVYHLVGKYGWHWGKIASTLCMTKGVGIEIFNKNFLAMHG